MSGRRTEQAEMIFRDATRPLSAIDISQELGISKNAARQLLYRMKKEGLIRQEIRGYFVHRQATRRRNKQIIAPLKMHGIKIITKNRHGLASIMSEQLRQRAPYTAHKHRINGALTYSEEWEGRKATITIYKSGGAEINLSATDQPLDLFQFSQFCGWIQALAPAGTLAAWEIRQLGLNYDIHGLQLDGAEAITMQAFRNMWIRMYEHNKDELRLETHINIQVGLPEALDILKAALIEAQEQAKKKEIWENIGE